MALCWRAMAMSMFMFMAMAMAMASLRIPVGDHPLNLERHREDEHDACADMAMGLASLI